MGLQAGVFTNDLNKALYAARRLEVGGVMINEVPTFRVDHMPYGGVKGSGMGREGVKYAIREMTELKMVRSARWTGRPAGRRWTPAAATRWGREARGARRARRRELRELSAVKGRERDGRDRRPRRKEVSDID